MNNWGTSKQTKKKEPKITPKRTTFKEKIWYIIKPFIIYMLVKTFAMYFLAILIPSLPINGIDEWVELYARQLTAVINGIAAIIGCGFVIDDFLKEAATEGEIDIDGGVIKQLISFFRNGFFGYKEKNIKVLIVCTISGAGLALAFNYMIAILTKVNTALESEKYESVEAIQYSVPIWLGLILYGVISPFVEEIVFRGVLYNRMKRFYKVGISILVTALLFGGFHANLPQFLYGTIMGAVMAYAYEKAGCFAAPVLVHMAANICVFLMSVMG